ncbi:hypothetical protein P7C73_g4662, partial [Tremellales sp. Uapishka_1]
MPRLSPDYWQTRKAPRFAYLRSALPLLFLILIFSIFLSSYSLLNHFSSPARIQKIGWQSWDVVEVSTSSVSGETDIDIGGNGTDNFVPSIPLDNWDPLAIHTTGLTEIAVKPCYFPPYLFGSYCAPETTPELDKTKGKWVILEKDLNLRTGLWYLNVYYRRTRRLDTPLIAHIRLVPDPVPDTLTSELEGYVKANGDLRSGVWPNQPTLNLYYKTREQFWDGWKEKRQEEYDDADIITELDVVYGDSEPFYGFERVEGGKIMDAKDGRWESVDMTYRRGNPIAPRGNVPKFHQDGTFKIMQIADLHYSVGDGTCRDTEKSPCTGDPDTASWLEEALDAEKPDLVVFSGDQLNGQETSYDARSVFGKFAKPVIDRKIPWAAVFGNHDSEIRQDREYQMKMLEKMPYSLCKAGPAAVDGVGNYVLKLHSGDPSKMHLFTLYFLDSHDYQKTTLPWAKADYDYLKTSQIDWFLNMSSSISPISRPFQPDGAADLDKIWLSRSRRPSQPSSRDEALAKPNAMMFFHIPLPEAYSEADTNGYLGETLDVGTQDDGPGASKHNSGFFYNAIKEAFETDRNDVGWFDRPKTAEVKILAHGHCHNTDRCRRVDGIWMCFDGGSSYSGYSELGFEKRVRIYSISDYGEKVESYKRLATGEIIDQQVLVGDGAAAGGGQDEVEF